MTITVKVSENTKQEMQEFFEDVKRDKTPAYAVFQANDSDTVVTLYESGKAVFQGVSADISAQLWIEREKRLNPMKKVETTNSDTKDKKKDKDKKETYNDPKIYYSTTIGSDEVGTGDYFGPIVVSAAYIKKEDIEFLEELGVKDSKKMTDEKITEIVPQIIKRIPYSSMILTNKEYNEKYSKDNNMNKIKAILHNKVLTDMRNKYKEYNYIVVDQFAKPLVYYSYLTEVPNITNNIYFTTKAEDKCLSVACASLISRYIFLNEFEKLCNEVDMFLPKGASDKVDDVGVEIVKKYGIDKLKDIAKTSFKNTDKIKEKIEN